MINLIETFRSQQHLDSVVEEYYERLECWIGKKLTEAVEKGTYTQGEKQFTLTCKQRVFLSYIKGILKKIIIAKPCEFQQLDIKIKEKFEDVENELDLVVTKKDKTPKKTKPNFKVLITCIFDYDNFGKTKATKATYKWFAESLNINTCVYCNTQFAHVLKLKNDKIKRTYEYDHYYPKSIYPYFALSFYNLIPSCGTCNKGKLASDADTQFHPYKFDFDKEAVFSVDEESVIDFILGKEDDKLYMNKSDLIKYICNNKENISSFLQKLDLKLDSDKLCPKTIRIRKKESDTDFEKRKKVSKNERDKIKEFLEDLYKTKQANLKKKHFSLPEKQKIKRQLGLLEKKEPKVKKVKVEKKEEDENKIKINIDSRFANDADKIDKYVEDLDLNKIYTNHTDIVTELYQKKYHYPESRKKEISDLLASAGEERLTPEEITRMLRGSYIEREKILQRPLSKLIKDISDELDLI